MTINAIRVLNKSIENGEEKLLISTEWSDGKVEFTIFRDSNTPLLGEVQFDDFDKYAKSFDKSLQQYVNESKDIFCNKNTDVDFYLKGDKFFWKRKKWALGQVSLKPVSDIGVMTMYAMHLIEEYTNMKHKESEYERENNNLKLKNSQIISQLNTMISLKNQLETSLYSKFILILNSKKQKIRNSKSNKDMKVDKDIYDVSTDESENELEPNPETKNDSLHDSKKRLSEFNDESKEEKRNKMESYTHISEISENRTQKTGCSLNNGTDLQEDEETPDFLSDESVCEMELKLDEEGMINQEQSSEEMF